MHLSKLRYIALAAFASSVKAMATVFNNTQPLNVPCKVQLLSVQPDNGDLDFNLPSIGTNGSLVISNNYTEVLAGIWLPNHSVQYLNSSNVLTNKFLAIENHKLVIGDNFYPWSLSNMEYPTASDPDPFPGFLSNGSSDQFVAVSNGHGVYNIYTNYPNSNVTGTPFQFIVAVSKNKDAPIRSSISGSKSKGVSTSFTLDILPKATPINETVFKLHNTPQAKNELTQVSVAHTSNSIFALVVTAMVASILF